MSELNRRLAKRCGFSFFVFALTFSVQVKFLEHGWVTLMSLCAGVEYSYTDSEALYTNILRWEEPQQNYNRSLGVILSTRCAYFHIWAMCIPFFVIRGSRSLPWWGIIAQYMYAILMAGILVSVINFVRLLILFSAVNADIPWWLAHDIPNFMFAMIAVGLSIGYFLRKGSIREQEDSSSLGTLDEPAASVDRSQRFP